MEVSPKTQQITPPIHFASWKKWEMKTRRLRMKVREKHEEKKGRGGGWGGPSLENSVRRKRRGERRIFCDIIRRLTRRFKVKKNLFLQVEVVKKKYYKTPSVKFKKKLFTYISVFLKSNLCDIAQSSSTNMWLEKSSQSLRPPAPSKFNQNWVRNNAWQLVSQEWTQKAIDVRWGSVKRQRTQRKDEVLPLLI